MERRSVPDTVAEFSNKVRRAKIHVHLHRAHVTKITECLGGALGSTVTTSSKEIGSMNHHFFGKTRFNRDALSHNMIVYARECLLSIRNFRQLEFNCRIADISGLRAHLV